MIVGYQGIEGAFSHIASKILYPNEQKNNFSSFRDVFQALESNKIDIGVVPIENSYTGKIEQTNTLIGKFNVNIINKIYLPIHHNLAGVDGARLNTITHVFFFFFSLLQCAKQLKKILPHAQLVEKENTAMSANFVSNSKNKHYACLCSDEAVDKFDLNKLYSNMQDKDDNCTLFIAISAMLKI